MASEVVGGDSERADEIFGVQKRKQSEGLSFSGYERDLVALNKRDGSFLIVSGVSGADSVTDGRGTVYADFDNDGDLDIFLHNTNETRTDELFRNNVGSEAGFVRIGLRGTASGRDAFGATVVMKTSAGLLTKVKAGGSGFLSQWDPRLLFGLGGDAAAEWIEVRWPSGTVQRMPGQKAGSSVLLVEGEDKWRVVREKRFSLPDPPSAAEHRWRAVSFEAGAPVPEVGISTVAGEPASLAKAVPAKQTTLINFWATWCTPCLAEMPELQKLHESGRVHVIGLSVDVETDAIAEFARERGVTYPIYVVDRGTLDRVFPAGDVRVPLSLVVDAKRRVVDVFSGWTVEAQRHMARLTSKP